MVISQPHTSSLGKRLPVLSTGWLAGFGAVAGLGAVAASSCCALPVALVSLGATGAVLSGLERLTSVRPVLIGGAILAIVTAWALHSRGRSVACAGRSCEASPSSKKTVALLGVGTLLVLLALLWEPFIEPIAQTAVG
ncbi:mercuric transporter MerT family protein [Enterovirga aerilata]